MAQQAELKTNITADKSNFTRTINQAKQEAQGFSKVVGSAFKTIGTSLAAGVGVLGIGLTKAFEDVDKLSASASKLNIAASSFQFLQYAAKRSDVEIGVLEKGVSKLRISIGQAAAGNKQAAAAFQQLGLDANKLAGMKLDDAYIEISKALQNVKSSTEQALIVQKIFGKSGQEQLNILRNGLDGLKSEFDSLGVAIDDSKLAQFGDADKAIDQLQEKISGELKKAIIDLAPSIEVFANAFSGIVTLATKLSVVLTGVVKNLGDGLSSIVRVIEDQINSLTGNAYDPNSISPNATVSNKNLRLSGFASRSGALSGDLASNQVALQQATSKINQEQKITVEIKADKNGMIDAFVSSTNARKFIMNSVVQAAAQEAQATAL